MFEVGFSELLMVGLVSLLVIGPEKLPKVARVVGFWLGKARAISANLKAEIHHELELEEMKQILQQQQAQLQQQMHEQQFKLYAVENDVEHLSDLAHSAIDNPPQSSLAKGETEVQLSKPGDAAR